MENRLINLVLEEIQRTEYINNLCLWYNYERCHLEEMTTLDLQELLQRSLLEDLEWQEEQRRQARDLQAWIEIEHMIQLEGEDAVSTRASTSLNTDDIDEWIDGIGN